MLHSYLISNEFNMCEMFQTVLGMKCFLSVSCYDCLLIVLKVNQELRPHHKYRPYSPDSHHTCKSCISLLGNLLDTVSESEPSYF